MRTPTRKPSAKRYWIGYCRKSTDSEDNQVYSLEDQEKLVREYYAKMSDDEQKHELLILSESRSAFKPNNRPEFDRMLQMAQKNEVQGVIVFHANRISRNHEESGKFVQALTDGKFEKLITTDGRFYTANDTNTIFMLCLEGAVGWKDSKDKGAAILRGMIGGAKRGNSMGPTRIGYKRFITPDGKRTKILDEENARIIKQLFIIAANGVLSVKALTKWAVAQGLKGKGGKPIQPSAIYGILTNPYYKGTIVYLEEKSPGNHPPIIDASTWQRVQFMLKSRNTNTSRAKKPTLREMFTLGSLVKCGKCGRIMSPERKIKKKGRQCYVYYACKNPNTKCQMSVRQDRMEFELMQKLNRITLGAEALDTVRMLLLESNDERMSGDKRCRQVMNVEYEKVKEDITLLFQQRADAQRMGCLDELDGRIKELCSRRDEIQMKMNTMHDNGTEWIGRVIKCFELIKMAQELLTYGSWVSREAMLKAVASNYCWDGEKLVWDLRSPFKEAASCDERPEWWTILDSNQ